MYINHFDEFLNILDNHNIDKNDVCIVGSSAFFNFNFKNNDIDFILKENILKQKFCITDEPISLSENVQLLISKKYHHFFNIKDDEIINNPKYYFIFNGLKIIRPEIEYTARKIMKRKKDLENFPLLDKNISKSNNWDIFLVYFLYFNFFKVKLHNLKVNLLNKWFKPLCEDYNSSIFKNNFNYNIYPTIKFLARQFDKSFNFQAYDVIVRYGFAKEYLEMGLNPENCWFNLYTKMQTKRGVIDSHNPDRFIKLINDFKKNGYDYNSKISIDKSGLFLDDGSHRTALNLLFNQPYVSFLKSNRKLKKRNYDINWFKKNDFSLEELKKIEDLKENIFIQKGIYFPVILWGSVSGYIDEIKEKYLIKYGNVIKSFKLEFNDYEKFKQTVQNIYLSDDIEQWKIEKKLEYLKPYKNEINVIYLEINNPKFRKKQKNNHDISTIVEKIKKEIRNDYKIKIENYFYDIIVHICDNYDQNKVVTEVIQGCVNE